MDEFIGERAWVWVAGIHALATVLMGGVIWFVQIVHYPLMASVGAEGFTRYEQEHASRTTWLVMPLMLVELAGACALAWHLRGGVSWLMGWSGLGMLVGVWFSTFLVQVPIHGKLAQGYSPAVHAALLRTNWIRTVLWSVRGVIALWMFWFVSAAGGA